MLARARRSGVEILEPPDEGVYGDPSDGYGHRTIVFRDPERNVLEIYAEIETRLDGE